jgi:hypothetical protein
MSGATNGNDRVLEGEPAAYGMSMLGESSQVQEWLERAMWWFVGVGDTVSARSLLPVIDALSADRVALLEGTVEGAEKKSAAAMVAGG